MGQPLAGRENEKTRLAGKRERELRFARVRRRLLRGRFGGLQPRSQKNPSRFRAPATNRRCEGNENGHPCSVAMSRCPKCKHTWSTAVSGANTTDRRCLKCHHEYSTVERAVRTHPKFRKSDPDTSRKGWLDNLPRSGTQRRRIYDYVLNCEIGVICSDVVQATGIKWNSASTRISEMVQMGYLEENGERLGPDGSQQRIIKAADPFAVQL